MKAEQVVTDKPIDQVGLSNEASRPVILSLHRKWIDKIFSGEKTVEVRPSVPHQACPFLCYLYETASRDKPGKIVGMFLCTGFERLNKEYPEDPHTYHDSELGSTGMTMDELASYGKGRRLYAWKIENPTAFDEAMTLEAVGVMRAPQSWCYGTI